MAQQQPYYADSMAQLPARDAKNPPRLDVAHVTAASPVTMDFDAVVASIWRFVGAAFTSPTMPHGLYGRGDLAMPGMGIVFGLQCPPEGLTRDRVKLLSDLGIRFMGLAYDGVTAYGSGFLAEGGLTAAGCDLLEWMAEAGMILDLAHSNDQTAREALYFARQHDLPLRVAATHAGVRGAYDCQRNLSDAVLCGIAERDGYVGILLTSFFLCEEGFDPLAEFVDHVRHAIRLIGAERVGVGSDIPHVGMSMETAREQYDRMVKTLGTGGRLGEYFPDRPVEMIAGGDKTFPIIGNALRYAGFESDAAAGVLGGNFINFLRRSLP